MGVTQEDNRETHYLRQEVVLLGNLVQHLMSLNCRTDVSLQHLRDTAGRSETALDPAETANAPFHMLLSDLQSREEGQKGVHPGASREQRLVDVDIQQQRRLTDVLHYRCIVLNGTEGKRVVDINSLVVLCEINGTGR